MLKQLLKRLVIPFYKQLIAFKSIKHKNNKYIFHQNKLEIQFTEYDALSYTVENLINNESPIYNLSIIIPVYNSEKYIENCINSVLNQKTKYSYEVILINDGSTDNTAQILNKYSTHKNVEILNQDNSGISSARNSGLSKAKGEYIGFIDNDDWISDSYVETLLEAAYTDKADIVKCGYICVYPTKEVLHCNKEKKIFDSEGIKRALMNYDGLIWGGIQHRNIWKHCSFPEKYWFEDMITRGLIYRISKKFVYINKALYFKREHQQNASKTLWKVNNSKCLDQVFLVKEIIKNDRLLEINDDESLISVIIYELGQMLYFRTSNNYRKIAFNLASKLINDNFNSDLILTYKMEYFEKNILISLIVNDYNLWIMTIRCMNYQSGI